MLYEILADRSVDPAGTRDTVIGLIVIIGAIAAVKISRSATARASVGRATRSVAVGTVRATGRPVRAIGRRSRSGIIGRWGRAVVACEERSIAQQQAGKHSQARWWRAMGDAMIGSSRISCHVPGCDWQSETPHLAEVVAHLRSHRAKKDSSASASAGTETPSPQSTSTSTPTSTPTPTTGTATSAETNQPSPIGGNMSAETVPALAAELDARLIPAAQREVEASQNAFARAAAQEKTLVAACENMEHLGMPAHTLSQLTAAMEAAASAKTVAATSSARAVEAHDLLVSARMAIRQQETVAEAAEAAGGAMQRAAYNQ